MFTTHSSQGFGTIAIVLVVTALLVLGGGAYYFMEQEQSGTTEVLPQIDTTPGANSEMDSNSATGTSPENLAALFATTDSVTCTYADTIDGQQSTGEVYISGENMRGTFTIDIDSETTTNHIIRNGNTGYVWTSDSSDGFMMEIQDPEELLEAYTKNTESSTGSDTPGESTADITCEAWDEDPRMFVPPTNVNFVSVTQQMEQLQTITGEAEDGSNQDLCQSCAQIPDAAAQAQCRQALGC